MGEPAVLERPAAASSGGRALPPPPAAARAGQPAFAEPFEGWLAWADIVSQDAPGIGSVMRTAAQLYQAALEERAPDVLPRIWEILRAAGVPAQAVAALADGFLGNALPVCPDAVAAEIAAAVAELGPGERELLSGDGDAVLVDAASAVFLDGYASTPNSRDSYQQVADRLRELRSPPRWWVAASLELPRALGDQHSVYCAKPAHRAGDEVAVIERTYLGDIERGLTATVRERGFVTTSYRDSIDTAKAHRFWDNVRSTTGMVYAVQMIEGRRNRALRWLGNCLDTNGPRIRAEISALVEDATRDVARALDRAGGPAYAAHSLAGLLVTVATALVERIRRRLVRAFADESLTTWLVWHLITVSSAGLPISTFTLSRDGGPGHGLCFAAEDPQRPGQLIISNDYDTDPGVRRKARFMVGPSTVPGNGVDSRLWDAVAEAGAAVPWTDPINDGNGFRVLVPQTQERAGARYVTALRVDLQLDEPPDPPRRAGTRWL